MSLAIAGARLLDARGERAGDVRMEGGRIVAVGPGAASEGVPGETEVIDGRGQALIPGLINAHTHAAMVLFRGLGEDQSLRAWLENTIWPAEQHLLADHVYAGTRLAALEMLASGTTTFNDMYHFGEAAARAVDATGMRAVVSQVFFDVFDKKPVEAVAADVEAGLEALAPFSRVMAAVGPHAPYTVSLEALRAAAAIAERRGARLHFHLAETEREVADFEAAHGRGLCAALDEIGFLGPRLVAAHGIFLDERDAQALGRRGASIAHCPASNMKLASGWASERSAAWALSYALLSGAGVNVALGTDGAATSNDLDMFQAMRLAALLQKHATGKPTALTARDAFAMATVNGARALGLEAGLIEPGHLADLVLVDLDRPYFCPGHDLVADLVYAAKSECVHTVIVDGRVVLRDGKRDDARAIMDEARAAASDLLARARGGQDGAAPDLRSPAL